MKIKAVFFDAGNTLFKVHPSVGEVYARVARRHGCDVAAGWVEERFQKEWARRNGISSLKDERKEKAWWRALVRRVFGRRMSAAQFKVFYDELFDLFARPSTWAIFPDVFPTLKELRRRKIPMGVISNWDSRLYKLCAGLGVTSYMDFILVSAVEGMVKPEKAIFERALSLSRIKKSGAGLKPGDCLHVGDSFREDYWGARRAGLKSALISREGGAAGKALHFHSLRDILKYV